MLEIIKDKDFLTKKSTLVPPLWKAKLLAKGMWATLNRHDGVGLSAPQIGEHWRFFIMKHGHRKLFCLDPIIIKEDDHKREDVEACLSLPNTFVSVKRSSHILVSYIKETGQRKIRNLYGLNARIFLHEFDHLEGRLITDYVLQS